MLDLTGLTLSVWFYLITAYVLYHRLDYISAKTSPIPRGFLLIWAEKQTKLSVICCLITSIFGIRFSSLAV